MEKHVMLINVSARKESAAKVQQILTAWGCNIKTRLGLHEGTLDDCTETGLIFLELAGDHKDHEEMARKLNLLKGVEVKLVVFSGGEN